MDKIILSKFGGSSMADAVAIRRSAALAKKQNSSVVVVSATHGTTNQIISLINASLKGPWEEAEKIYNEIKIKHIKILEDMRSSSEMKEVVTSLLAEMETIARGVHLLKDCSLKAMDTILSLGERMSSAYMTDAMKELGKASQYFDVRKVLRTNDQFGQAVPNIQEIKKLSELYMKDAIKQGKVLVTQGFIGETEEGLTTTLGRGGSDYSASLLAEGIDADVIEIWTDVAGVATTDPRLCATAKPIDEITYQEAAELATFGAKVLHPTTLWPAMRKNIPVFVGSSINSEERGTWIKETTKTNPLVRAIALRENQSLLTLTTPRMLNTHGFLYQVFKVFNDYKLSVDLVTTSEISVSITVNDVTMLNKNFVRDLSEIAELKFDDKLSLISLVGSKISETSGLAKKIFGTLEDINIRMICLGASSSNICFLVDAKDGKEAVKRLHDQFI
jgi:aspartate kinase